MSSTLARLLDGQCEKNPDRVWLRDRKGDDLTEWTWLSARAEIGPVAAWLEERYGASKTNIALLSRNRAHWCMADLAIIASGNVTVPLFTTLPAPTADYIFRLTETRALILGEAGNWEAIRSVLPASIDIITLPGVEIDMPHTRWEDILDECAGRDAAHRPAADDLVSVVFTSGTTGAPKGVMQTHDSFIIPIRRTRSAFGVRDNPRYLSYLPLSHVAERMVIHVQSLIVTASVTFNEAPETLLRDLAATRPNYLFGPPRVWEQLQQAILAKFGSQRSLDEALAAGGDDAGLAARRFIGLDDTDYLLTAAAPTPPALIEWYARIGLDLLEGFGQTEIMGVACNYGDNRKIGSVGRLLNGVEMKVSEQGELIFRAAATAAGYYKMPEKTRETFEDGWVRTGDKGYVDDDGFIFLTGRVKDYFKTMHGKFVAPVPIENRFADNPWTEQVCLLGRGYSKTAMLCVISAIAQREDRAAVEKDLLDRAAAVNEDLEHHARIGAVLIAVEPWTIESELLTPTLKIRREQLEQRFGEQASRLARQAAEEGSICAEWIV